MAKFENEGYCPNIWVPKTWGDGTDSRLNGLWSLVGQSIVYKEECNSDVCNEVFGIDIIAYDVLSAIVKKNVNARSRAPQRSMQHAESFRHSKNPERIHQS